MVIILRLPFHEPPAGQGRGPQPPGKCGVLLLKCHRGCDERDDIRVLGQRVVLTPHRSLVATAGNIIGEPVVEVSRVAPPRRKKPLTIWLIISGVWQARNLKLWRKNPRFENFPSRPRQPSTARDERVSNSRKPRGGASVSICIMSCNSNSQWLVAGNTVRFAFPVGKPAWLTMMLGSVSFVDYSR